MIRTSDLPMAAYLMLRGHELLRLEPGTTAQQRVLVFREEAAEDMERFERGATVPAKAYARSYQQVKRLVLSSSHSLPNRR